MRYAFAYGADAVYAGQPRYSLRARNNEFRLEQIGQGIAEAHARGKKFFLTSNLIAHNDKVRTYLRDIEPIIAMKPDAMIMADPGLIMMVKEKWPEQVIHLSVQANTTNHATVKFWQKMGVERIILSRELSLDEIEKIRQECPDMELEVFVHGALCVAYSGQCYITHAHTGRSANRGDCNQACRLPYEVTDASGRIIAHEKHVLSMKDNNQSDNLRALIDAGVRSFKIEGRYKDMGYVKNITAHYRKLLDEIIEEREFSEQPLARSSSGTTSFSFEPDPDQNFNREFTDYFVNGRKDDIGAFDTPKTPGRSIGWVTQVGDKWFEIEASDKATELHNGDGLCYYDLQKELVGVHINRVECMHAKKGIWRLFPKNEIAEFKDLRKGLEINRNRDMDWVRMLEKKSSERRIGLWAEFKEAVNGTTQGFALTLTDEDGFTATASIEHEHQSATDAAKAEATLREQLGRFGASIFSVNDISLQLSQPWFVPASALNQLRRDALAALEQARTDGLVRLPRAVPVEPPAPFPEDTLTYLSNVFNQKAHDFYVKHGVKVIDAAYESKEEEGEVSLMITKHCVRFSMSLCPKQA
ncbi:MAG: DUF3656 domain-containing protein, partial [Comamonas sp.]